MGSKSHLTTRRYAKVNWDHLRWACEKMKPASGCQDFWEGDVSLCIENMLKGGCVILCCFEVYFQTSQYLMGSICLHHACLSDSTVTDDSKMRIQWGENEVPTSNQATGGSVEFLAGQNSHHSNSCQIAAQSLRIPLTEQSHFVRNKSKRLQSPTLISIGWGSRGKSTEFFQNS